MAIGTVKWFNNAKGYGLLTAEASDKEVFIHFSAIEMEGYKTGANIYLSKPFLPQKLLSIIKNQLYTQQKAITHHTDTHSDDSKQLIGVNLKEQEFFDQVSLFIEKNLHKA